MISYRIVVWAGIIVSTTLYLGYLDLVIMQHTEPAKTPLPPDLYSLVLEHIVDPSDLAKLCQVDRGFLELGRKRLYTYLWMRPWENQAGIKFQTLFRTLAECPELASLVDRLVVTFYPRNIGADVELICNDAFRNMTSLSSLTWTRDSTLSSNMLETLATLPKLRRIEINGHSIGIFDPKLLWKLGQVREISVVLPDRDVVMAIAGLAILLHESGGGLEGLEIIAQDPSYINDEYMTDLAPYLGRLKTFKLLGCRHVTEVGFMPIIAAAADTLEVLGLRDVGDVFGSIDLTQPISDLRPNKLRSLKCSSDAYTFIFLAFGIAGIHTGHIIGDRPGIAFQEMVPFRTIPDKALYLENIDLGRIEVEVLAQMRPGLEKLMIDTIPPTHGRTVAAEVKDCVRGFQSLRQFHVREVIPPAALQDIAEAAGPELEQIGSGPKVYHVKRRLVSSASGETRPCGWSRVRPDDTTEERGTIPCPDDRQTLRLVPWNRPGVVPEIFQVWTV